MAELKHVPVVDANILDLLKVVPVLVGVTWWFGREQKPKLPPLQITQEDEGQVFVFDYAPGLNLYLATDYDPKYKDGTFTLDIQTSTEYPGTKRSHQREATAVYNEKGLLTEVQSSRFFGEDFEEALGAGVDELMASNWAATLLLQVATEYGVTMSELAPGAPEIAQFYESLQRGIQKYEATTEEPNVVYRRIKDTNKWNVSINPRNPEEWIPSDQAITARHSLGKPIQENKEGIGARWRDQRITYYVATGKQDKVSTTVFQTRIPQTVYVPGLGLRDTTFIRLTEVPSKIDPNKTLNFITNSRKDVKNFRKWFPVTLLKP